MKKPLKVLSFIKYLSIFILALTMIFPFLWMISTSLKYDSQVFTRPIQWIPNPLTLNNYKRVWVEIPFLRYALNTTFVTVTATFLQVLISALAAYAFAKIKFKGSNIIFTLYLSTMMVPWHTLMIPQYIVMQKLNLPDTFTVLILGQLASAFGIFLLRQFFMTIPNELREAAHIDGANEFATFFRIILPQATAGISTLVIFTFINVWNDYLAPLIYINSSNKYTIQLGLSFFQSEYSMKYSTVMAGTVFALIPILIIYLIFEEYITQGIAFTGLKG